MVEGKGDGFGQSGGSLFTFSRIRPAVLLGKPDDWVASFARCQVYICRLASQVKVAGVRSRGEPDSCQTWA